ncbi:uroporphyrinogen-III C-methyltransferase [Hymenobacter sp. 15J16-1T3B]|uniref:uroporphyrinogen-III C-methyltransferase n=1 Tax=Hymenobacter sp. 15J16-1T3B TaxID=2886941 RepID=UPI001D12313C|nr:uroporphyrinogen-III C-methyltransferase [Hymenobacter sp. 15J16-1T3B]MCC3155685.1 uroporphyrinogen-III C-methyltransferase [Hymenobacter sp. 15J16-1T3B]
MSSFVVPRLTVVGAGPGDPELITVKGARVLAEADVVLYDALSNAELLDYARPGAKKVYVGKRKGTRAYLQQEINDLIVLYARVHGHVVRLKGGDPFVFGRGREEMLFAQSHGLQTAYVPGISSAVAVPGSLGIPVTHRGLSEAFRVITATTASGELSQEVIKAAQAPKATAVILMGMSQVEAIADAYVHFGHGHRPAAVIQDGTLPTARLLQTTVAELPRRVAEAGLTAPAIIVIGEVVDLAAAPADLAPQLAPLAAVA